MAVSSESDVKPPKAQRRLGIGTILSILILAIGVYYFVHVQRKTAYFAARNLRILNTVTAQIVDRIQTPEVASGAPATPLMLLWDAGSGVFEAEPPPKPDLNAKAAPATETPRRMTLDQLVRQVFEQSFVSVFDVVIVADEKGVVRWQHPRGICSATNIDDMMEKRGFGEKQEKIKIADLQRRAVNTQVMLEGREYRLFTQPLPVKTKVRSDKPDTWIVAGVVSKGRFAAESVTVSYTLLILVLAVFLLVIFSLPFLKLNLMGELQRVRVSDIILLGVSLLCAISIITIIFLDAVAYRRTRLASDAQLRRLASDVKRHMRDEIRLAYAALVDLEESTAPVGINEQVPADIRTHPAIVAYPYFESFSRIGEDGMQRQKWHMEKKQILPIPVADRDYFLRALHSRGWSDYGGRYVLEAIRSRTTGLTQAVIAKRVRPEKRAPDNAVVSLAFPMLSLIDTVIAGDCQFAVIDNRGQVVFHSESQRNNVENFFVETDQDRTLRAAVAGRQNEMVNLRYWGDDQRAFATPIDGTPWTLVTFRSKRLLRTLNVETIMITVMFLMIHALGYTLFGALVAIGRPSYRAPWLWPDHDRGGEYLCLITSYVAFSLAFAVSIYLFRPRIVLVIAALVPALTLFLTFIRLKQGRGMTGTIAAILAILASIILLTFTVTGQVETDVLPPDWIVRIFIILMGFTGIVAALFPVRRRTDPEDRLIMPGYSYVIGAAGLLFISAVLPTAALYKAAYKIESESFVKHGQVTLVQELEERTRNLDAIQRQSEIAAEKIRRDPALTERWKRSNLGVYAYFFGSTEVFHHPGTAEAWEALAQRRDRERKRRAALQRFVPWTLPFHPETIDSNTDEMTMITGVNDRNESRSPIPRFVQWLLPQYSDHSIRMRQLIHSQSADKRWTWRRRGDDLDLDTHSIYGPRLITTSSVPRLLPRYFGQRTSTPLPLQRFIDRDTPDYSDVRWETDNVSRVARFAFFLMAVIAYVAFIVYAAYFISRKVFLVDLRDPLWLNPRERVGPALGGNMLIFAPTSEAALRVVDRRQFIRISLESLEGEGRAATEAWSNELTRVDRQPAGKGILIPDFDRAIGDPQSMALKLRLLESAITVHTRNVVAITTISPWVLMDLAAGTEHAERWRALLSTFNVRIEGEAPAASSRDGQSEQTALARRVQVKQVFAGLIDPAVMQRLVNGSPEHAHALIARETADGGDFLNRLGLELCDKIRGREEIYDEIGERAAMYYSSLWASCTGEEKTVLLHIAADGFANSKDRYTIRRLLARGLIRRAPNFKVMNETFRRFVVADARRREVVAFETSDVRVSAWDKIQKPLMIGLVVGGGFFFFTQRELFDASFAVVSGVAGGIPAVLRLVGVFTSPREAVTSAR